MKIAVAKFRKCDSLRIVQCLLYGMMEWIDQPSHRLTTLTYMNVIPSLMLEVQMVTNTNEI